MRAFQTVVLPSDHNKYLSWEALEVVPKRASSKYDIRLALSAVIY